MPTDLHKISVNVIHCNGETAVKAEANEGNTSADRARPLNLFANLLNMTSIITGWYDSYCWWFKESNKVTRVIMESQSAQYNLTTVSVNTPHSLANLYWLNQVMLRLLNTHAAPKFAQSLRLNSKLSSFDPILLQVKKKASIGFDRIQSPLNIYCFSEMFPEPYKQQNNQTLSAEEVVMILWTLQGDQDQSGKMRFLVKSVHWQGQSREQDEQNQERCTVAHWCHLKHLKRY